jgi:hypothetical protein
MLSVGDGCMFFMLHVICDIMFQNRRRTAPERNVYFWLLAINSVTCLMLSGRSQRHLGQFKLLSI